MSAVSTVRRMAGWRTHGQTEVCATAGDCNCLRRDARFTLPLCRGQAAPGSVKRYRARLRWVPTAHEMNRDSLIVCGCHIAVHFLGNGRRAAGVDAEYGGMRKPLASRPIALVAGVELSVPGYILFDHVDGLSLVDRPLGVW